MLESLEMLKMNIKNKRRPKTLHFDLFIQMLILLDFLFYLDVPKKNLKFLLSFQLKKN